MFLELSVVGSLVAVYSYRRVRTHNDSELVLTAYLTVLLSSLSIVLKGLVPWYMAIGVGGALWVSGVIAGFAGWDKVLDLLEYRYVIMLWSVVALGLSVSNLLTPYSRAQWQIKNMALKLSDKMRGDDKLYVVGMDQLARIPKLKAVAWDFATIFGKKPLLFLEKLQEALLTSATNDRVVHVSSCPSGNKACITAKLTPKPPPTGRQMHKTGTVRLEKIVVEIS